MNAPALNPAASPATATVGSTGAAAAAAGQAGSPLAGFEALLTALFPQGAAAGANTVAATADKSRSDDVATLDDPALERLALDDGSLTGDANAALLAGTLAPPPVIAGAATPVSTTGAGPGQSRAPAVGATQPLFNPDPAAGQDEAPSAGDEPLASPGIDTRPSLNPAPLRADAQRPLPNPDARAASAPAPASPAVDLPDPALATPAPATLDANAAETASTPAAATATTTPALSPPPSAVASGVRPEPTPPRTTRTDRSRSTTDVQSGDDAKPLPQGDAIATSAVKPVAGAAPSTGAQLEKAESADRDADVETDVPDATLQAETRATASSLTPAALTAHGVRGSPETVATLAAQIIKKLEGQSTRFDLELNPAGLGKVDVRIDIGAHGRVSAAMMFDNPQAAADLRARASELQRILEQAGFDMSGGLSFDVAGDRGQQHRQAWQDQNDNAGHAFRGQAFRAALDTAGNATDAAIGGALRLRHGVNAGLDLRI